MQYKKRYAGSHVVSKELLRCHGPASCHAAQLACASTNAQAETPAHLVLHGAHASKLKETIKENVKLSKTVLCNNRFAIPGKNSAVVSQKMTKSRNRSALSHFVGAFLKRCQLIYFEYSIITTGYK